MVSGRASAVRRFTSFIFVLLGTSASHAATPTVTGVSPSPVPGTSAAQTLTVYGTNFQAGASVTLRDLTYGGTYPKTPVSLSATALTISAHFTTNAATWSVQVTNPGGAASSQHQFTVSAATPTEPLVLDVQPATTQTVERGGALTYTITVRTSQGQPVTGAGLVVSNGGTAQSSSVTTNPSGAASYTTSFPLAGEYLVAFGPALKTGFVNSALVTRRVTVTSPSPRPSAFTLSIDAARCSQGSAVVPLRWSASEHATSYTVYRVGDAGPLATALNGLSFDAANAVPGQVASYFVEALNQVGKTSSAIASVTVPANVCGVPAGPPEAFTVSAGAPRCNSMGLPEIPLQWTPARLAASYDVVRSGAVLSSNLMSLSAVDAQGLTAGQTYVYRIAARNGSGVTESNTVSVSVPTGLCASAQGPPGPFSLTVDAPTCGSTGRPRVVLRWTSSSLAARFEVLRNGMLVPAAAALPGSATTYVDEGDLLPGASYTYLLRASNAAGVSTTYPVTAVLPVGLCLQQASAITVRLVLDANGDGRTQTDELFVGTAGPDCPGRQVQGVSVVWNGTPLALSQCVGGQRGATVTLPAGRHVMALALPPDWEATTAASRTVQSPSFADVVFHARPLARTCTPPRITHLTGNRLVDPGQGTFLTVAVDGTAPFSYQWYAGQSGDMSRPIPSATENGYATPGVTGQASFWAKVENSCGRLQSNTIFVRSQGTDWSGPQCELFSGSTYAGAACLLDTAKLLSALFDTKVPLLKSLDATVRISENVCRASYFAGTHQWPDLQGELVLIKQKLFNIVRKQVLISTATFLSGGLQLPPELIRFERELPAILDCLHVVLSDAFQAAVQQRTRAGAEGTLHDAVASAEAGTLPALLDSLLALRDSIEREGGTGVAAIADNVASMAVTVGQTTYRFPTTDALPSGAPVAFHVLADGTVISVVLSPASEVTLDVVPRNNGTTSLALMYPIGPGTHTVAAYSAGGAGGQHYVITPSSVTAGGFQVTTTGSAQTLATTALLGPNDQDGDTLPDAWEQRYGLSESRASGDDGAAGDPDGDGATNQQEYRDGSHPRGHNAVYLAEGATGFFDTTIALLNPDPTRNAEALLRFMKADGTPVVRTLTVPSGTRRTIGAGVIPGLQESEFSCSVESDRPLVIDRTMSWDARGYGSHSERGIAAAATRWYLAEGATHSGFDLFYLILNPGEVAAAVEVRYLRPAPAPPVLRYYEVPAHSRFNIWVDLEPGLGNTDVSAVITANVPVIVERAMYLNAGGQMFGAGHESAGVTTPATAWFLAEGATGPFFDLFILVANPDDRAADIRVDFLLPRGDTVTKTYRVAGQSRFNIWVDLEDPRLVDTAVSTRVTSLSGVPVIVERAMWWPGPATSWAEAHNSAGSTETGVAWATADAEWDPSRGLETYILIANTSTFEGRGRVALLFEDGSRVEKEFRLPPTSRTNVAIAAEYPEARGRRFGVLVESLGEPAAQIVVERAVYSNANGTTWAAGANALATRVR